MTGEISRWLARARPWFSPDPWQASGQSEMAAEVRAGTNAIDVSQAKLSVSNLHVTGVGWTINEPRVELAGDLHWNGATGEVASQSAQFVSSAVSLAAKDVRLQAGGASPPRANGVAAFRTDLARLAAWRDAPGSRPPYQPQGMVTGNVRFDQQATASRAKSRRRGEKLALLQMNGASRAVPAPASRRTRRIWQEPQVNIRGTTTYEPAADRLAFQQFQVQSTTLAVMADGQIDRLSTTADVNANGSLNYDLAQITPLLKPFVGEGIQLVGRETARFQATGSLTQPDRALVANLASPLRSAVGVGERVRPADRAGQAGCGARDRDWSASIRWRSPWPRGSSRPRRKCGSIRSRWS